MLLTITTTHTPATDLGYLLHKNPARVQTFDLNFGKAHVFYPEASEERCTAALLLEIDPVALSRSDHGARGGQPLEPYVNDRPYAASSFLSVAISQVFGSALGGRCKERPDLPAQALPLSVRISALPCRAGGAELPERLFGALGYAVAAESHLLDSTFPEWGDSAYYTVTLSGDIRLQDLLSHLYVLIPVLDNEKHYWVGDEEVEKLLRQGEGWLGAHPERELIVRRYLKFRRTLADEALARLVGAEEPEALDDPSDEGAEAAADDIPSSPIAETPIAEEAPQPERRVSLHDQRLEAVRDTLKAHGVRRVLDLGCGEGKLLRLLLKEPSFTEICGMDVAHRSLQIASDKLHVETMSERQRDRLTLFQGSLIYRDKRLAGYDGAAIVEVIEHLDPSRLEAFERVVFEYARPGVVALTTPNAEYNVVYETLSAGKMRHSDHRFEWTREQFQSWANAAASRHGYSVTYAPIGPEEDAVGAPSQMAVFTRTNGMMETAQN